MPACPPNSPVLFVNFDGATLSDSGLGVDNAPAGVVGNADLAGDHAPFMGPDRDEIFSLVQSHYEPFGLCVTDEVPMALDYDMIVVTSDTFQDNGNIVGFPGIDCGNVLANNVNVVFLSPLVDIGTARRAIAVSKFAAGFYGLEDVSDTADIMNQFIGNTLNGATFTDQCLSVIDPTCPAVACEDGSQNSQARLAGTF